jgi:hypothetical protein
MHWVAMRVPWTGSTSLAVGEDPHLGGRLRGQSKFKHGANETVQYKAGGVP